MNCVSTTNRAITNSVSFVVKNLTASSPTPDGNYALCIMNYAFRPKRNYRPRCISSVLISDGLTPGILDA